MASLVKRTTQKRKKYGKTKNNKNSSGDEIANVNFFTTISHTYFKIPKKRTYFV